MVFLIIGVVWFIITCIFCNQIHSIEQTLHSWIVLISLSILTIIFLLGGFISLLS